MAAETRVVEIVAIVGTPVAVDISGCEKGELLGMRDGQSAPEHCVDETEGRGGGADGQRERENGGSAGGAIPPDLPPPENDIGSEGVEPWQHADIAASLAILQSAAERATRVRGRASMRDGFINVGGQLLLELAREPVAAEKVGQSSDP